jgi:hypothetical protein
LFPWIGNTAIIHIRTREYGAAESYKEFISRPDTEIRQQAEKDIEELWE